MALNKKTTPPDRIRGFTSLSEHEASAYEGKIVVSDHDGYRFRRVWHRGEWWHSVVDVVGAIAETTGKDTGAYWRKLKQRLKEKEGASQVVTSCHELRLPADDGKNYKTDCAPTNVMFRIIESMPVPRAEPIKQFLAQAGAERLEEITQPSKAIDRAIQTYRDKGRDDEWIDGRVQNISSRNELTDEWQQRGFVGRRTGALTASMSKEMLGVTPAEHKVMKQIGERENLRDRAVARVRTAAGTMAALPYQPADLGVRRSLQPWAGNRRTRTDMVCVHVEAGVGSLTTGCFLVCDIQLGAAKRDPFTPSRPRLEVNLCP